MALRPIRLDDRYTQTEGTLYLTGMQALVRLPMLQKRRDEALGRNTAGFISGYRGSPLGGFDRALAQAKPLLERHAIHFQPGVNEDLAATAIWGTQQVALDPRATVEGVFALWYGKGPGVDRSGDALKHANMAGTARWGGVLALAGDDHVCASSTLPHQSEFAFVDAMIPVLAPAGVEELIRFGLAGWAMSRASGLWVALACVADVVESAATLTLEALPAAWAAGAETDAGGLNLRWPDPALEQERRLHELKIPAARAFARANGLDACVLDAPRARLGIATQGKAYGDVLEALELLGLDAAAARALGLRLYKIGLAWPLEPEGAREFACGLEEILVVEEKRGLIEPQLKEILYGAAGPRILGKEDGRGGRLLPSAGELSPPMVARVILERLERLERLGGDAALAGARERLERLERPALQTIEPAAARQPYFCAGCPHNRSTRVPEGSRAMAGIGCHYMAQWMERETAMFTQMGAEGANWLGQAPFTRTPHMFQNIGDGTYYHSGLLAIRAAVAAKANITYKILYNDAVAMTGGQPLDGPLDVAMITRQLEAEGVRRIAVVSENPGRLARGARSFAAGTSLHHRRELDAVQRRCREEPGVSAIIYDQACATEKRRRRKRGLLEEPARRVFINERVCEGCGDCSKASNCLAVVPHDTDYGRKRRIDEEACNKDESCLEGFCPSFVVIEGADVRRARPDATAPGPIAEPERMAPAERPWNLLIAGIGGTGVVTTGQILAAAAASEGLAVRTLDHTGLAQKYGAVFTHVRLARREADLAAARIAAGSADLLLGLDPLVAASAEALAKTANGRTQALIEAHAAITGEFVRHPEAQPENAWLEQTIGQAVGGRLGAIAAADLARTLAGQAASANLLLLGAAYQKGLVPVSAAAIEEAIAANGVALESNLAAFRWGRQAVAAPEKVAAARPAEPAGAEARGLQALIERRAADLADYQNEALAARYRALLARVRAAEAALMPGREALARAAARSYHKLLAYKDEYEVARLYSRPEFKAALKARFEDGGRIHLSLAPPLISRRDPATGRPRKRLFGPWILPALGLLARLRFLRASALDPFARTPERKTERRLIGEYEALVEEVLNRLSASNYDGAVELLGLAEEIRGFGPVKDEAIARVRLRQAELMGRL